MVKFLLVIASLYAGVSVYQYINAVDSANAELVKYEQLKSSADDYLQIK